MQTSLGGVFRGLLILACAIVVPLVALSDSALQELAKRLPFARPGSRESEWTRSSRAVPAAHGRAGTSREDRPTGCFFGGLAAGLTRDKATREELVQEAIPHKEARPAERPEGVIPTAYNEQAAADRHLAPRAIANDEAERLRSVEQRLRALGAVHYLLESWGTNSDYYRFQCRVSIGGSPTAVRYFEATDRDGLSAMSKVLADIETCTLFTRLNR